ncbi:phage replisome organizer N-terminal domain-containing protein [Aerococcus urinaeequi]|uniref:phage replisome organizer N-terminal domain-containing protein n=1 Tax=Aerococcus urinaeequi TaxID=51665 RepID=UPI003D6B2187
MADVKWIKLSVNMFDDEKIKLIRTMPEGDKIIVIWVQLLCLAGKTNDGGSVYMGQNIYYTDEMLATICNQTLNTMRLAISTLEQFGMIEKYQDGLIEIANWSKHQSTDKMEQMKIQNRERQQKYYYRQQLREIGYEEKDIPDDLEALKKEFEKPNVSLTLPNATEVRSKKIDVRSKRNTLSGSDEPDRVPYEEITDYLNEKAGSQFRSSTKKTQSLIKARFNEGFKIDDFKRVIDIKTDEWLNNKEMSKYLRPETLFGTKFESYLNQEHKPVSNNSANEQWLNQLDSLMEG